jgi:hypothetical protein
MEESAFEVLVRKVRRRTCEPAVGNRVPQRLNGNSPQLYEYGGISVEVGNRKENFRMRGEHGLFLAEILDANSQDRSIWRGLVAEPLEVRLAERPFPRE